MRINNYGIARKERTLNNAYKAMRAVAFCLALLLLLSFSIFGEEKSNTYVPSIYVGDSAWYKHKLFGTLKKDGTMYIPISVFSAIDVITYDYYEQYSCFLLTHENGKYVSISIESKKLLTNDGTTSKIQIIEKNSEYYIDVKVLCDLLELTYEEGFFYDTDIVRISGEKNEMPLKTLVEINKITASELSGDSDTPGQETTNDDGVGILIDLTVLDMVQQKSMLDVISSLNIKATYIINTSFLKNDLNINALFRANASGSNFAIKAETSSNKVSLNELNSCNNLLDKMFRQKTRLYFGPPPSKAVSDAGYINVTYTYSLSDLDIGKDKLNKNDILFVENSEEYMLEKLSKAIKKITSSKLSAGAISRTTGD